GRRVFPARIFRYDALWPVHFFVTRRTWCMLKSLSAEHLSAITRVFGSESVVLAAWLFGSVARGRATPSSDVDFAVLLRREAPTGLDRLVLLDRLARALGDVLGVPDQQVDVVSLNEQGVLFQHNVLRTGRLIYEADTKARVLFVTSVIRRYLDFRPTV